MPKRKEEFQQLLEKTAAEGFISNEEQSKLDRKARSMGLSLSREKQIAEEGLTSMGIVRTAETPAGLSLSFRSHDALEDIIKRIDDLSAHDRSVLMAHLAVNFTKSQSWLSDT